MENSEKNTKPGKYLTFILGEQCYGIQIETVREINRLGPISPVPQVSSYVAGLMNLRGKVVPIVDLSMRFGFPAAVATKATCVIVIEGKTGQVGAIVDRVSDVTTFDEANIEPAPDLGTDGALSFVIGIGKSEGKVIILVDATTILTSKAMASLQQYEDLLKVKAA